MATIFHALLVYPFTLYALLFAPHTSPSSPVPRAVYTVTGLNPRSMGKPTELYSRTLSSPSSSCSQPREWRESSGSPLMRFNSTQPMLIVYEDMRTEIMTNSMAPRKAAFPPKGTSWMGIRQRRQWLVLFHASAL